MTPTERAKRSDALYYETVSVTRRVLCDMIANREADLEDAQAECARLRQELAYTRTHWELDHCPACPDLAAFQERGAENAKLRELVDYMTPIAWYAASEQERDRMRELGVEVFDE